jgi:MULE transposase domain
MTRLRWNPAIEFRDLVVEPDIDDRTCRHCGVFTNIYENRDRRLHLLAGPTRLVSKLAHCVDTSCPGHREVLVSPEEMHIAPPYWTVGWDVFAWMGHRRFARHWSVPQIRAELKDRYAIAISPDSIATYLKHYQVMVAARESAPAQLAEAYRDVDALELSIDGLQPEKGHETLYVVRELRRGRVWFAIPLLSSAEEEVQTVLEQAAAWAKRLDKPVRCWVSDKQQAFVNGIAAVFPGVTHRYCKNHFLRDLAKPVLERDSHAKVTMRHKVRGLRKVEQGILKERRDTLASAKEPDGVVPAVTTETAPSVGSASHDEAQEVVLAYAAGIRGILNDGQGGPLDPPGLRMAEALGEVRDSLHRCTESKKGGLVTAR